MSDDTSDDDHVYKEVKGDELEHHTANGWAFVQAIALHPHGAIYLVRAPAEPSTSHQLKTRIRVLEDEKSALTTTVENQKRYIADLRQQLAPPSAPQPAGEESTPRGA